MREKLYTVREAAQFLNVTERDIIDLCDKGLIPAYKVGGVYLRFKKEHLESMKGKVKSATEEEIASYALKDKVSDFLAYNDFYIFSFLLISIFAFLIITL